MAVIEELEARPAAARPSERAGTGSTIWLSTPHWLLMTVRPSYAPLFAQLHERNGDHFRLAMTTDPAMTEPSFWTPLLEHQERAFHDGTGLFLAGFCKGAARAGIGCSISFSGIVHDDFETCWLGYRLDRTLEGRGLMHEALAAAIPAVFERYGLHRIMASHLPENLRSARVLRRLGFGIDGYARDFMRANGQWRDNVLLSLLAPGC
jgi:ribosomal-protein-alanine N-acetyltransferase